MHLSKVVALFLHLVPARLSQLRLMHQQPPKDGELSRLKRLILQALLFS